MKTEGSAEAKGTVKVGVVAEYDPFHRGHAWQLAEAKRLAGAERAVAVMSGCFTQRGMPALLSPDLRAEAALRAGADAVCCLPALWAVREAEQFALCGVHLLGLMGCGAISFGAEDPDAGRLRETADLLESGEIQAPLKERLRTGIPYPQALAEAAERLLPGTGEILSKPNNTLGVCYLRAIRKLGLPMRAYPVPRAGSYHATALTETPSASAVRSALLRGDWRGAGRALPDADVLRGAALHRPEALDTALLARLRTMTEAEWAALPGQSEGVGDRLREAARNACTREELLAAAKTRRYPLARLNRLCACALLGVTGEDAKVPLPGRAWVLGFRRGSEGILADAAGNCETSFQNLPEEPWKRVEERAWDLWTLGAGLPAGAAYRRRVVAPQDGL